MPPHLPPTAAAGTAEFCPDDLRLVYEHLHTNPDGLPLGASAGSGFASRYQLLDEVARGGMGVIWRVHDTRFDRPVAVKLLRPELAARPTCRARFLREARLHARLHHPAVVPVYDLGEADDGRPFLTMEYIDGWTLHRVLARPDVRAGRAGDLTRVFRRVCQAVAHAHGLRVLHRDLKPHNVMITRDGKVRLIDWGLATVVGDRADDADPNDTMAGGPGGITVEVPAGQSGGPTQHGAVVGTPGYMAPEQARGEYDRVDERADVFGLGAVLCEVLTGRPPFAADTPSGVWDMTRGGDLADARDRLMRCRADVRLVKLCLRCLSRNPLDRPRDAAAVLARLDHAL
jgi:serine/threonine protein kinase